MIIYQFVGYIVLNCSDEPCRNEQRDIVAQETKRIVRVMTTDIDGQLALERALRKIKGVSFMFSKSVCTELNLDCKKKVGDVPEEEIKKIEEFIKNPKLPEWMLNRRKDSETGENLHLSMAQLQLKKREDINTLRRIRAYRGIRHELGQPTRGQRTRSTFRTNKSVGVSKKRNQPAAAAKKG